MRPALFLALFLGIVLGAALALRPAPVAREEPIATPTPTLSPSPSVAPTPTPSPTPTPRKVDGMRIVIARLRIDLPIKEGEIDRDVPREDFPGGTPEGAAFHFPGTVVPGEVGNSYVYAHARVGMFLALWNIRVGDEVLVQQPDGTKLRYLVAEIHSRVPPSDVSWLQPTEDERLTLQTSTGPFPGDPRFIVVALPAP